MHRSHSLSGIQYVGRAVSLMMPFGISKTEATAEMELTTTSPYFRALKITISMCRYVMELLNNFKSYLKYIIKLNTISKVGHRFVEKFLTQNCILHNIVWVFLTILINNSNYLISESSEPLERVGGWSK